MGLSHFQPVTHLPRVSTQQQNHTVVTSGVTQTQQPPPARGRRQNKQVVLRHESDQEPSAKQLRKRSCPNPKSHWADTGSGHSHTGKAELAEAGGELGPKQSSTGSSSSGTDWGDSLQLLLALRAGAGLGTGAQGRQL